MAALGLLADRVAAVEGAITRAADAGRPPGGPSRRAADRTAGDAGAVAG
ncbi:hypothetical protein [Streptomyces lavendulocolor]